MQKSKPFARALAMIAAMAAPGMSAMSLPTYVSRGKGKGLHTGKKWHLSSHRNMHVVSGRWVQIENGSRERIRRMRQMGTLSQVEVASAEA